MKTGITKAANEKFDREYKHKTFGRLKVLERILIQKNGHKPRGYWKVQCTCSVQTIKFVRPDGILNGTIISCGCWDQENKTKHNESFSDKYRAWLKIKTKCFNKSANGYIGDKVTMNSNWVKSYEKFIKDVGKKPGKDYILKRHDETMDFKNITTQEHEK